MSAQPVIALDAPQAAKLSLTPVASFPGFRVLCWDGDVLFASRGYEMLRTKISGDANDIHWEYVGEYQPPWWRNVTSSSRLTSRLFRDGFHALAVLPSEHLIAAVPHAIVTLPPGEKRFRLSHRVVRGTRPLHIAATPDDRVFWGEYFDNVPRDEAHVYASADRGTHWDVAYTFPNGQIRHIHNIVYDQWGDCLWILTGDNGAECRILRASRDFRNVDVVFAGKQQARSAALIPTREAVYFSSDTPFETNRVYRLDRAGNLSEVMTLASSSIFGCRAGRAIFFSTMVEPSTINRERNAGLYGSADGSRWDCLLQWQKDRWPIRLFQYGNVLLPDGNNTTSLIAATTVAVEGADYRTMIWQVQTVQN
jgi:hypothetical protein